MKSRQKRIMNRKRHTTTTNDRSVVHKYIPIDEHHNVAVRVGRCKKCAKITECSCDNCGVWHCVKHLDEKNEYCEGCKNAKKQSYFG